MEGNQVEAFSTVTERECEKLEDIVDKLAKREPLLVEAREIDVPHRQSVGYRRTDDEFSVAELLFFLWRTIYRRKWLIFTIATIILVVTSIQLETTSPIYRTSAKLAVDTRASAFLPYRAESAADLDYMSSDAFLQTQREVLLSESVLSRVVTDLALAQAKEFTEHRNRGVFIELFQYGKRYVKGLVSGDSYFESVEVDSVELLRRDVAVRVIPGTRLLEISYQHHDPELANRIVNGIAEAFVAASAEDQGRTARETLLMLVGEVQKAKESLESAEAALVSYSRANDILNLDRAQEIRLRRISEIDAALTSVETQLISLQAREGLLRMATPQQFPEHLKNPEIIALETRQRNLEEELSSLSTRFGRNWPGTVKVQKQFEEVQDQIRVQKQEAIERAREQYEISSEHFRLSQARLRREKRSAEQLSEDLIDYTLLEREVEANRAIYNDLLKKFKEARVSASLPVSHVQVMESSKLPTEPGWPNKVQFVSLALAVGLLFGFGVALTIEGLGSEVSTSEEVERITGLPCLALVPRFKSKKKLRDKSKKHGLSELQKPSQENASLVLVGTEQLAPPEWESYRILRTLIRNPEVGWTSRSIAVTSAQQGEGKSTTALNMSIALAQSGVKTLLVDLDLRSRELGDWLNTKGQRGISDFLNLSADLHSLIRETDVKDLCFLPGGSQHENPADLVESKRLDQALNLLSEFFDTIVIDSPAVLRFSDASVISRKADKVLLVVEAEKTDKKDLQKALVHLKRVGAQIAGTIMNSVEEPKISWFQKERRAAGF